MLPAILFERAFESLNKVEQFTDDTTYQYFVKNKKEFILPINEVPTGRDIIGLLNSASVTMTFYDGEVDGLTYNMEDLQFMQNNPHHLEGSVANHNALGFYVLRFEGSDLSAQEYEILERAMFWSDLGKRATAKPHKSKTWDDGTEITTAHGHAKKSVEILDEAVSKLDTPPWWYEPVRWLVAEHMNAHNLEANKEKTVVPDFLAPQIEGLEPWERPAWNDLEKPHGDSKGFGKSEYNWINRNHKLLIIKQKLDEIGRISDLSF